MAGIDYLGEPTPYDQDAKERLTFTAPGVAAAKQKELIETGKIAVPSRSSYFGILDLAGFRKDRFYLYQARWRPDYPMAHILSHWTWPERIGQVTPVQVYTSGDEAELFLNGRSLGRKRKGLNTYRLRWDEVAYEPGELRVLTFWFRDRNAFNGLCQVIVHARDSSRPGRTIAVTACVAGLPPARAEIRTANPPP